MRSQRHVGAFVISWPYVQLGDMDHAFEWLETALEERDGLLVSIKHYPTLQQYAKDPRYQELVGRIGIP